MMTTEEANGPHAVEGLAEQTGVDGELLFPPFERLLYSMIDLYLIVEKIHWYLNLTSSEHTFTASTQRACEEVLSSIQFIARIECRFDKNNLPRWKELVGILQERTEATWQTRCA